MTKSIAKEIEALRAMTVPDLVERYEREFGKPPRVKHREHLWKRIAWRTQERLLGGLSRVAQRRLEELIAEIDLPLDENQRTVVGRLKGSHKPGAPAVGTVLTRRYKGQDIQVQVLANGFEWDGTAYRSLSAVAKAVTGSHWSGNTFFFGRKARKEYDGTGR